MPYLDFSGTAQPTPIKTVTDPRSVSLTSDTDNILINNIDSTRRGIIVKNTSTFPVTITFALLSLNATTSAVEAKNAHDIVLQPQQEYLTDFAEIVPHVARTSSIGGSVSIVELKQ